MPVALTSGSLNFLELLGPVQACNGVALPLPLWEEEFAGFIYCFFFPFMLFRCVRVCLKCVTAGCCFFFGYADSGSLSLLPRVGFPAGSVHTVTASVV